ncbi:MAG TPA: XdhC/CoxI family protein [Polyangiaceae bacterium]|nr:XdhC/CoxI family protein [Polyangiaceae bacterium]
MREIAEALLDVLGSGRRGALATVVAVTGSAPQRPGARLLLHPDGALVGTVGGGAVELQIVEALKQTLVTGEARKLTLELGPDLGMCCGGRMEIFVEVLESAARLLLFGAGHVARPTAALARTVGFDVTVFDTRPELNTPERFPGCRLSTGDPVETLRQTKLMDLDRIVIVTHEHRLAEQLLAAALEKNPRYVGLVGSRRKVLRFVQRIGKKSPDLELDRVYAPVGLDIGAVSPEEIAVSIVAELVALRHGARVPHLRLYDDPRFDKLLEEANAGDAEQRPIPLRIPTRRSSGEGR